LISLSMGGIPDAEMPQSIAADAIPIRSR